MNNKELVAAGEKREKLKRGPRKDRSLESGDTKPGDNAKFLRHSLEIFQWGEVGLSDPKAVQERSMQYLQKCVEDDIKPSIEEYALSLGLDRFELHKYREGRRGKNEEVRHILKETCNFINAQMAHYMQNGKINPVAGIFLMKNNMGYADKQEMVLTPNNPLGEVQNRDALEAKYADSVIIDAESD